MTQKRFFNIKMLFIEKKRSADLNGSVKVLIESITSGSESALLEPTLLSEPASRLLSFLKLKEKELDLGPMIWAWTTLHIIRKVYRDSYTFRRRLIDSIFSTGLNATRLMEVLEQPDIGPDLHEFSELLAANHDLLVTVTARWAMDNSFDRNSISHFDWDLILGSYDAERRALSGKAFFETNDFSGNVYSFDVGHGYLGYEIDKRRDSYNLIVGPLGMNFDEFNACFYKDIRKGRAYDAFAVFLSISNVPFYGQLLLSQILLTYELRLHPTMRNVGDSGLFRSDPTSVEVRNCWSLAPWLISRRLYAKNNRLRIGEGMVLPSDLNRVFAEYFDLHLFGNSALDYAVKGARVIKNHDSSIFPLLMDDSISKENETLKNIVIQSRTAYPGDRIADALLPDTLDNLISVNGALRWSISAGQKGFNDRFGLFDYEGGRKGTPMFIDYSSLFNKT